MIIKRRAPKQFGATKLGSIVDIVIEGKLRRDAEFLGSGRFSNVFKHKRDVFVYSHFGDYSKDVLTMCQHLDSPHIPVIESLGWLDGPRHADYDIRVYRTKQYQTPVTRRANDDKSSRVIKRTLESWNTMKTLHEARIVAHYTDLYIPIMGYGRCEAINYRTIELANVPESIKEALTCIADNARCFDDYLFDDFAARNLGLDGYGRLVFLDPLFNTRLL